MAHPAASRVIRLHEHRHPPARDRWLVVLLTLIVLGSGFGWRAPWGPDEPRYALVAHEMVEGSSWLLPHRHGMIYGEKPPVGFWAMAGAEMLTGSWRLGFLLPGLLAGLGTVLLVHDFTARWRGRQAGLAATAALLAMTHGVALAKSAQLDPQVTFWATLGLVGVLKECWWGPRPWWFLGGCLAMGIGVITKGTAFLPLLVVPIWWVVRGDPRRSWRDDRHLLILGLCVMLLPAMVWLAPLAWQAWQGDPDIRAYLSGMLIRQTAGRYAAAWHHHEPPWYFLEVLLTRWQPWTLLAFIAVPHLWRRWRRADPDWRALLLLFLAILLFFSLSPGKRALYLMPLMPIAAILTGSSIAAWARLPRWRRWARYATLGCGVLVGITAFAQAVIPPPAGLTPWSILVVGMMLIIAASLLIGWGMELRGTRRIHPLVMLLMVGWVLYGLIVAPVLDGRKSWETTAQTVAAILPDDAELGMVGPEEGFALHLQRPIHWLEAESSTPAGIATWQNAGDNRWLLLRRSQTTGPLPATAECINAPRGRDYHLIPPAAQR